VGFGLLSLETDRETIRTLAEVTLAMVLFTDAAGADMGVLKKNRGLPIRLLLIGLPLTILLGFGVGVLLVDSLSLLALALLVRRLLLITFLLLLLLLLYLLQQVAVIAGIRVLRVDLEHLIISIDCALELTLPSQRIAKVVETASVIQLCEIPRAPAIITRTILRNRPPFRVVE